MTTQTYWRVQSLKTKGSSYEYDSFKNLVEAMVEYLQRIQTCEYVILHEIETGLIHDNLKILDSFSASGTVPSDGGSTVSPPSKSKIQSDGVCPYCGGENLNYGEMEVEIEMSQNWSCPDCGAEGTEWYRLSFDGHTTRDGDVIPKGGK